MSVAKGGQETTGPRAQQSLNTKMLIFSLCLLPSHLWLDPPLWYHKGSTLKTSVLEFYGLWCGWSLSPTQHDAGRKLQQWKRAIRDGRMWWQSRRQHVEILHSSTTASTSSQHDGNLASSIHFYMLHVAVSVQGAWLQSAHMLLRFLAQLRGTCSRDDFS